MKFNDFDSAPEQQPLGEASKERLVLINETNYQLERLGDFSLEKPEGRLGLKVALDQVFTNAEKIEGTDFEIIGLIKERIRDAYAQLYEIKFNDDKQSSESQEFYREIEEIMTMIENRGRRFIEDMDIYQSFNGEQMAA